MIKDRFLKMLFIPVLGLGIPYLSRLISYAQYDWPHLLATHVFFIFMSWCIWACSAWMHHKIRGWFMLSQNIFIKITTVALTNALFGGAIAGILTLIWYRFSGESFAWDPYLLCIILSLLAVVIFTLVYEILYLSKERQLDSKKVYQLDRERTIAELSNLKNELEPHFIFNSLNALSYLILNDAKTAHIFNGKLATIYKYFLINKDREIISLEQEMDFIKDYMYLLQLRHDNHIQLYTGEDSKVQSHQMILPFALQITIENAIKHNEFSAENPLQIEVEVAEDEVHIKNNLAPKSHRAESTNIGLRNLRQRYRLVCNKDISIQRFNTQFVVTLPLISKINGHDTINNY